MFDFQLQPIIVLAASMYIYLSLLQSVLVVQYVLHKKEEQYSSEIPSVLIILILVFTGNCWYFRIIANFLFCFTFSSRFSRCCVGQSLLSRVIPKYLYVFQIGIPFIIKLDLLVSNLQYFCLVELSKSIPHFFLFSCIWFF